MDQLDSEVSDFSNVAARTNNPMCKCGRRSRILTAFTLPNFGRRFYTCGNYVVRFLLFFSHNPCFFLIFSHNCVAGLFHLIWCFLIQLGMVFSWVYAVSRYIAKLGWGLLGILPVVFSWRSSSLT
jgi:hypothetical protein